MPATIKPAGSNGPIPAWWNAVLQAMQQMQADIKALQSGQQNTTLVDANGNAIVIIGQLSQTVTIGAQSGVAGVQVMTNLSGVGVCVQQELATGTITVTAGSTAATLNSTTGGTFSSGLVIGAANIDDPSSGTATPAIVPGTTFTITGSAITLSQQAAESGSGILCAACQWTSLQAAL